MKSTIRYWESRRIPNWTTSRDERIELSNALKATGESQRRSGGLLDYARAGPLLPGEVSLFELVRETLKLVEHQLMFRNLILANRVPPDVPSITENVNRLSQILMNLLMGRALGDEGFDVFLAITGEEAPRPSS